MTSMYKITQLFTFTIIFCVVTVVTAQENPSTENEYNSVRKEIRLQFKTEFTSLKKELREYLEQTYDKQLADIIEKHQPKRRHLKKINNEIYRELKKGEKRIQKHLTSKYRAIYHKIKLEHNN